MNLQNKTILVLGLGATGLAVCEFVSKRGAVVIGVDDSPLERLSEKAQSFFSNHLFSNTEDETLLENKIDLIITSPGVPLFHPLLSEAKERKIPITGELEFASHFTSAPVIAVTGTNGKSTTTELVGAMLKNAGKQVMVGGNLGEPWLSLIQKNDQPDFFVLEVSSFQLETVEHFHAHIAALLNITDDHFERHQHMRGYIDAKARICLNQNETDFFVYNSGDIHVLEMLESVQAKTIPFSSTQKVEGVYWKSESVICSRERGSYYDLSKATLEGLHNIENMMAAIAMAELAGVPASLIQKTLENFKALPHRLEWVREVQGVNYYDDSKGTNVGAVAMSVASFDKPVILILGGKDKGGDYGILKGLLRNKVKALVLIGEAKEIIRACFEGLLPILDATSMEDAVYTCSSLAAKDDVVLLSPACSSFDMFKDYKHRGDEFQKWVKKL
ncbi:MAG: UDP-N-acetylmuramoyl-L-alanine--D-glutamate ligase [Deltaproteobacteria bacterium]|nr:UDP-N-acetylmuramoyl-L-alanine--D-glutamate ligase [Deltaproteobacteria bacterium]